MRFTLALGFILCVLMSISVFANPNYGDVNGDGIINSADSTLLRRYIAATDKEAFRLDNSNFNLTNTDLNGDNIIDENDLALLRSYLMAEDHTTITLGPSPTPTPTAAPIATPVLIRPPSNKTVTEGQTVTFDVEVTANPAPTYQWQVSQDGGRSFIILNGQTYPQIMISGVALSMNGYQYRCVVYWNGVAVFGTSTTATLNVKPAPDSTSPGAINRRGSIQIRPGTITQWSESRLPGRSGRDFSVECSIIEGLYGSINVFDNTNKLIMSKGLEQFFIPTKAGEVYRIVFLVNNNNAVPLPTTDFDYRIYSIN